VSGRTRSSEPGRERLAGSYLGTVIDLIPWREATESALYGDLGFYRLSRPDEHYRTSVGASSHYAAAMITLLVELDARLGHPDELNVVDVGSGTSALLTSLIRLAPRDVQARLRLTAVELGPRPDGLPPEIAWLATLPESITGLVVANEWLDNVPVEVVTQTAAGPRLMMVDPTTGAERLGGPLGADDLAWLRRWWPLRTVGTRAEIGRPRDEAWAGVVRRLERGIAIAADYHHRLGDRPPYGTLTGYRNGRQVAPVPDGSCDLTAHVALDACAAAGLAAGATHSVLTSQRQALRALGIRGDRPSLRLAHTDPRVYLRELQRAFGEGELLDRAGLGGFGWLVQSVGGYLPAALAATMVV
jgi:SAM-dependent MidA family methyltransferase